MTQIAGPEALPDTMRRFADREGGLMWRENKIPTFVLKKTFVTDEEIQRVVSFTAARTVCMCPKLTIMISEFKALLSLINVLCMLATAMYSVNCR
jgi:hypothetical protein